MPPDPCDGDLSLVREAADNIPVWLAIWEYRAEPDAHARQAANDALYAIDAALAALHRVRARLVGDVRQADDAAAVRADELLARTREGTTG